MHPSPLHPLCHTHKEISDCTAFFLSYRWVSMRFWFTHPSIAQNSISTSQILSHRQRGRHVGSKLAYAAGCLNVASSTGVFFGVLSMIFFPCASVSDLSFLFTRQTSLWARTKRRFVNHNTIKWDFQMLPTAPDKTVYVCTHMSANL